MAKCGKVLSATSAALRAARYSGGLARSTPAAFINADFTTGSSWFSAMILRHAKICSWMLILTGQTLVQEPFRVEANGNDEYLWRSNVGSRITPMGPG